jgi:hypothetical protein
MNPSSQRPRQGRPTVGVDTALGGALPRPVEVVLWQRSIPSVAHAVRVTRRGHQTLVSLGGHRWWVPSSRVSGGAKPTIVGDVA